MNNSHLCKLHPFKLPPYHEGLHHVLITSSNPAPCRYECCVETANGYARSKFPKRRASSAHAETGWNSWNTFKANINQTIIEDTATALVKLGLADAGYEYVSIDAGWQASMRAANGQQQPNASRFPSGIKGVADHVHDLGLKLGIYRFVPVGSSNSSCR